MFVLLIGALFWVYILLWIIVPSQSLKQTLPKRLYRNPDDKVIAGVCGGLAAYFNIDPWIPRLIFALPLILGFDFRHLLAFLVGLGFRISSTDDSRSLGSTLFITYIILWISVPVATTAAEKLEMRGERVDLNSIRDTVKEDMSGFQNRREKWGAEVKQTAQNSAKEQKNSANSRYTGKTFAPEAAPAASKNRQWPGHVIGVLFKAFFLFIAGMIALTLFGAFIGLLFGGFAVFPLKNFVLEGFWQNLGMGYTYSSSLECRSLR